MKTNPRTRKFSRRDREAWELGFTAAVNLVAESVNNALSHRAARAALNGGKNIAPEYWPDTFRIAAPGVKT